MMPSLSTGAGALRSDEELILASREDPEAFRELYDRWAEPILQHFVRRVLDVEIAADLMAETFAAAFESRARFVMSGGRVGRGCMASRSGSSLTSTAIDEWRCRRHAGWE